MPPPGRVAAAPALLAVCPSSGILRPNATCVQPRGRPCYSRGLATFSSSHRAKLCALPPLCGSACHPEERRRAADSAGQTVVAPRGSSDRADLISNGMRPIGLAPERGVTSVCAGHGLYLWAWLDLNQRPHPYQIYRRAGPAIIPPTDHHRRWKPAGHSRCCPHRRGQAALTAEATRCDMWRSQAKLLPHCWQRPIPGELWIPSRAS
jgi:hypothetical protein